MMQDKTSLLSGSILSQLARLSVPLLLGSILQQFYNLADAWIVQRLLGTDSFAAVGISSTVMNLFVFVLTGFCTGAGILFSELFGKNDSGNFRKSLFTAILFGGIMTLLISAAAILLLKPLLLAIHTPEGLMEDTRSYMLCILAGLVFTYMYNLFSAVLRAIGDTKASFYFLVFAVILNIPLDFLCISALGMGVCGAAFATVLSQLLAAAGSFIWLKGKNPELICKREDFGWYPVILKQVMKLGVFTALNNSSLYIGKLLVQGAVDTLGTQGIAAYTAASRIEGFANAFGTTIGQSATIFVSQNLGAGNMSRIKEGLKKSLLISAVLGVVFSVVLYIAARPGTALFLGSGDEYALSQGEGYLKLVAYFYILLFVGDVLVGFFHGMEKVLVPFAGTTMHITLRVIVSYLMIGAMGLNAVALGTSLGWILTLAFHTAMLIILRKKLFG